VSLTRYRIAFFIQSHKPAVKPITINAGWLDLAQFETRADALNDLHDRRESDPGAIFRMIRRKIQK
jgi:hypothetical protein